MGGKAPPQPVQRLGAGAPTAEPLGGLAVPPVPPLPPFGRHRRHRRHRMQGHRGGGHRTPNPSNPRRCIPCLPKGLGEVPSPLHWMQGMHGFDGMGNIAPHNPSSGWGQGPPQPNPWEAWLTKGRPSRPPLSPRRKDVPTAVRDRKWANDGI